MSFAVWPVEISYKAFVLISAPMHLSYLLHRVAARRHQIDFPAAGHFV